MDRLKRIAGAHASQRLHRARRRVDVIAPVLPGNARHFVFMAGNADIGVEVPRIVPRRAVKHGAVTGVIHRRYAGFGVAGQIARKRRRHANGHVLVNAIIHACGHVGSAERGEVGGVVAVAFIGLVADRGEIALTGDEEAEPFVGRSAPGAGGKPVTRRHPHQQCSCHWPRSGRLGRECQRAVLLCAYRGLG